jgi:hypothetical protein
MAIQRRGSVPAWGRRSVDYFPASRSSGRQREASTALKIITADQGGSNTLIDLTQRHGLSHG